MAGFMLGTPAEEWDRELIADWIGEMSQYSGLAVTNLHHVAGWQYCLWTQGLYGGPIDGSWNVDVTRGTLDFQQLCGLAADGRPGVRTCALMGLCMSESDERPPTKLDTSDAEIASMLLAVGKILSDTEVDAGDPVG